MSLHEEYITHRPTVRAAEEILGLYFPVLDHGFVSLVDYMGSDEAVEQAARVSYGAGTRKKSETRGLIRYLHRHKHTTPSEMVELKFHCCMPIFIARQWIRHRTANVNEMSGRYSLLPMLFYTPEREQLAVQKKDNKQGRESEGMDEDFHTDASIKWRDQRERAKDIYGWLTANDVAREIARIDLPLSTYTQWYWKIDLHNLMHFLTLRTDVHAQWEIQQYGKVMAAMMKRVAPASFEAWIDYDVLGVRFSRMEMEVIRRLIRVDSAQGILAANSPDFLNEEDLKEEGIAGRERDELLKKLSMLSVIPNFDLDVTLAKPGSFFQELFEEAVPKGERGQG